MSLLKVSTRQRWWSIAVLLACASIAVLLAAGGDWAWYLVAAIFLALAWLVLNLPPRAADPPVPSPTSPDLLPRVLFAVAIAFRGAPPLIFDRLQADGWTIGGHGPFEADPNHDGFVTVEVEAASPELARAAAGRAVRRAGARVERVGEALILK